MSDTLKKGEENAWLNIQELKSFNVYDSYLSELNELRKKNDLQGEVISELVEENRELKKLSKNKSQDNNNRLQGLIDESFELIENCNHLPRQERLELRIKLIRALK